MDEEYDRCAHALDSVVTIFSCAHKVPTVEELQEYLNVTYRHLCREMDFYTEEGNVITLRTED